jgi:hypothetical protein
MTIDNEAVLASMPSAAEAIGCAAPDVTGIGDWLNTVYGNPLRLHPLRRKVVLVDFWAYSCMNSRRAIAHVVDWYRRYKNFGFDVVGIHSPEYAFEQSPENVGRAAAGLGVTPDRTRQWTVDVDRLPQPMLARPVPPRHLRDRPPPRVRRRRLAGYGAPDPDPASRCIPGRDADTDSADNRQLASRRPAREAYLAVGKAARYSGTGTYGHGHALFDYPPVLAEDTFGYRGAWMVNHEGATAVGEASSIKLNCYAENVYIVAGWHGAMTVPRGGATTKVSLSRPPNLLQIAAGSAPGPSHIEAQVSPGIQAFSFAYG